MAFQSYGSIGEVAKAYQITLTEEEFIRPLPFPISEHFREETLFAQREVVYANSESAICENLIYPPLKEVWKPYRSLLTLWSHQPLRYDDDLCGVPDYLVAKRSPLGRVVFDQPYLIVVEAKRDDFVQCWGQCLAAMLAAQKLNADSDQTIYGIASNGLSWSFGKLHAALYVQHPRPWTIYELDPLMSVLHFVFEECKQRVQQPLATV